MAANTEDTNAALSRVISDFIAQLSSSRSGSLAQVGTLAAANSTYSVDMRQCPSERPARTQIWMPEAAEDGSIVLNTQVSCSDALQQNCASRHIAARPLLAPLPVWQHRQFDATLVA